jgi:hypothetical protein
MAVALWVPVEAAAPLPEVAVVVSRVETAGTTAAGTEAVVVTVLLMTGLANAWPVMPNATAIADAKSVFFMVIP